MNREFWSKPNKWPRDQEGFVFLARAAEEIGRKLFGSAWDAEIAGYDADLSSARAIGYTGPNSSLGMEAALERKARLAEATSRLQRVLDPVRSVIAVSAAAGAFVTALRPVPGGGLGEPLPANCWNTDDQRIATRFDFCRMSREDPFDNRAEGHGFIFIESK